MYYHAIKCFIDILQEKGPLVAWGGNLDVKFLIVLSSVTFLI